MDARSATNGRLRNPEVVVKRTLAALALIAAMPFAARAGNLNDTQAADHIGEENTICGTVASVTSSAVLPGRPTYLNFGHDYPNQDFIVVIFGNQRAAVAPDDLKGKRVCVTGTISGFQGPGGALFEAGG
jgi:hypothetical protein